MKAMTKETFLEKVFDYSQCNEWRYQDDLPCLIDFHDDNCPPCQAIVPILDKLSKHYQNDVNFYKVDTNNDNTLARELGIVNLPTLVLCPKEDKPIVIQGAISEEKLAARIETELLAVTKTDIEK